MIAQDRLTNLIIVLASGWLLYLLSPILTPFVAAFLLAYIADPLVDFFERRKISRTLSVVLVFIVMIVLLGAVVLLVAPLVSSQASALFERLPGYVQWVESRILPLVLEWTGIELDATRQGLAPFLAEYGANAANWIGDAAGKVSRQGAALVGMLVNLFLLPVLTFYLLRDWDRMIAAIDELLPVRSKKTVQTIATEADQALGGFLRGQVLVMLALATIYSIGLWALDIEFALAIGVVSGIVSFVPYLGLIVGLLLAGLAAVAQEQSMAALVGVVAVFVVAQLIEGMFLTPRLVGERIGLHPVLVIFAVMAGGQLFGFFGVLLALPAAAVVSVVARFAYQHYFFAQLYDDAERQDETGTGQGDTPEVQEHMATVKVQVQDAADEKQDDA